MILTLKEDSPTEKLLDELKKWRKDAKLCKQTALYDFLSEINDHVKNMNKLLDGRKVPVGFTYSVADAAFSEYIRKRDNYTCQKCGKSYPATSNGLQCSHHFSRRYYTIRFDPDNAIALCHHCHNYWFSKDVPEAARWLEQKIGKDKIDRLIELKNQKQKRPTQSELDSIAEEIKSWS